MNDDPLFNPVSTPFGNMTITVSCHQQDQTGAQVSEYDLPDMRNWGLRTRDREPYVVVVTCQNQSRRVIAKAMFGWWGRGAMLKEDSVFVSPHYRRRGIASAMYARASHATGGHYIRPSPYHTREGDKFWAGASVGAMRPGTDEIKGRTAHFIVIDDPVPPHPYVRKSLAGQHPGQQWK